ncbi:VOC family protein [Streptomyces anulatus]|uniref:VOC family protein n=2 Tax=Streptomyces TaxID=1883 RepID=UPI0036498C02
MRISPEMITIDCADPQGLAAWWAEALGVEGTQDYDGFVILAATPLVLGFQRVPEPKAAKNRVHVDFSSPDRPADVERLAELGATVVGEQSMEGMSWTVLQDPEGNEFCLSDAGSHSTGSH